MPRRFVWHPGRGPNHDAQGHRRRRRHRCEIRQVRSGIGHSARMRQTLQALGLRHHQDVGGTRVHAGGGRPDQTRAPPGVGHAGGEHEMADTKTGSEAHRARHPAPGSRVASQPQAARPRSGIGYRQDIGQGHQGHQGARGASWTGRRQATFRRRPDAAHSAGAEAWLHQSVPRRSPGRASRCAGPAPGGCGGDAESLAEAGSDPARKGPAKLLANGSVRAR